jgi:preprotein translocase subunit YajC
VADGTPERATRGRPDLDPRNEGSDVDVTLSTGRGLLLAQQASDGLGGLVLPLFFLVLLYVLLIRPQAKRRKELTRLVASLSIGDLVASVGGIHGEIVAIDDATVDLAVTEDAQGLPDVVIRFDRVSIVRVIEKAVSDGDPGEVVGDR